MFIIVIIEFELVMPSTLMLCLNIINDYLCNSFIIIIHVQYCFFEHYILHFRYMYLFIYTGRIYRLICVQIIIGNMFNIESCV